MGGGERESERKDETKSEDESEDEREDEDDGEDDGEDENEDGEENDDEEKVESNWRRFGTKYRVLYKNSIVWGYLIILLLDYMAWVWASATGYMI